MTDKTTSYHTHSVAVGNEQAAQQPWWIGSHAVHFHRRDQPLRDPGSANSKTGDRSQRSSSGDRNQRPGTPTAAKGCRLHLDHSAMLSLGIWLGVVGTVEVNHADALCLVGISLNVLCIGIAMWLLLRGG